ncbi:MAG: hypothetical protein V3W06_09155 [Acidimicrobiia bacterium]
MNLTRRTLLAGLAKLALLAPLAGVPRFGRPKEPSAVELMRDGWRPNPTGQGGHAQQWYRPLGRYNDIQAQWGPAPYETYCVGYGGKHIAHAEADAEMFDRVEPEPLTAWHFDPVFEQETAQVDKYLGEHRDEMADQQVLTRTALAQRRSER